MKPVPRFWWDFDKELNVIVQSDQPGGECLARFVAVPGEQDAESRIQQAQKLIADFEAGRATPRRTRD